jgi:hypothetical protein
VFCGSIHPGTEDYGRGVIRWRGWRSSRWGVNGHI